MYAMLHQFLNDITTESLSTVAQDFLKEMIILKSFTFIYISNHKYKANNIGGGGRG